MVGKRTFNRGKEEDDDQMRHNDVESGNKKRRFGGFKDAVEYAMDRRTTAALKEQLREGVLQEGQFEKSRKSDEEVRCVIIRTKQDS
jgi:hypothetical protein